MNEVVATLSVVFIDLIWKDKKGTGVTKTMANQVAKIYNQLSSGRYVLNITVKNVKVPYNHNARNLNKAVDFAKNEVGKYDLYVAFHNRARPYSNAGIDTAYCKDDSIRTCLHEIGHLKPLRLGHAGKYIMKKGKRELDDYGDKTSFMGRFPTYDLNAPQMWYLGWLPEGKYVTNRCESSVYTLEQFTAKKPSEVLKAVRMPLAKKDIFISLGKNATGKQVIMLHYRRDGGSQLVKEFQKTFKSDGFVFTKLSECKNTVTIKIEINLNETK